MRSTNRPRLERLIAVLEQVRDDPAKARDFDLHYWGVRTPNCGTHCCAVGWGAQDPELMAQGLSLIGNETLGRFYPVYQDNQGWSAVTRFFGLNIDDAKWLFSDDHYRSPHSNRDPSAVIERLRRFIGPEGMPAASGGDETETLAGG